MDQELHPATQDITSDDKPARERLIESAREEFAEKGLAGARIGEIAKNANINKQLVYHYFGSKEALYSAVLEYALLQNRARDAELDLSRHEPLAAIEAFIEHLMQTSLGDPRYQRLLLDANWHGGRHLQSISDPALLSSRRIPILADILDRGAAIGVFRRGIDPLHLYLSILGTFSIRTTNAYTLSRTLGIDLLSEEGRATSHRHALDLLMEGLRARD